MKKRDYVFMIAIFAIIGSIISANVQKTKGLSASTHQSQATYRYYFEAGTDRFDLEWQMTGDGTDAYELWFTSIPGEYYMPHFRVWDNTTGNDWRMGLMMGSYDRWITYPSAVPYDFYGTCLPNGGAVSTAIIEKGAQGTRPIIQLPNGMRFWADEMPLAPISKYMVSTINVDGLHKKEKNSTGEVSLGNLVRGGNNPAEFQSTWYNLDSFVLMHPTTKERMTVSSTASWSTVTRWETGYTATGLIGINRNIANPGCGEYGETVRFGDVDGHTTSVNVTQSVKRDDESPVVGVHVGGGIPDDNYTEGTWTNTNARVMVGNPGTGGARRVSSTVTNQTEGSSEDFTTDKTLTASGEYLVQSKYIGFTHSYQLSGTASKTIKIDKVPPVADLALGQDGVLSDISTDEHSGVDRSLTRVQTVKSGSSIAGSGVTPSDWVAPTVPGAYDIWAWCGDNAGNTSGWTKTSVSLTIKYSTAPNLVISYGYGAVDRNGVSITGREFSEAELPNGENITGGINGWTNQPLVAYGKSSMPVYHVVREEEADRVEKNTYAVGVSTALRLDNSTPGANGHCIYAWGAPRDDNTEITPRAEKRVKIDRDRPTASASLNPDGTITNLSTDSVSFIRQQSTKVYFSPAGGPAPTGEEIEGWQVVGEPGGGSVQVDLPTTPGAYNVFVRTMDYAGNTSSISLVTNGQNVNVYVVEFYGLDPTTKYISLSVSKLENGKVTKPADPVENGYLFKGWFTEANCVTAWDFVNGKITPTNTTGGVLKLYSRWMMGSIDGWVSIPARIELEDGGTGDRHKIGTVGTIALEIPADLPPNIVCSTDPITVSANTDKVQLSFPQGSGSDITRVIQVQNADGTNYAANTPLATVQAGGTLSEDFRLESLDFISSFKSDVIYSGWMTFVID